MPKSDEKRFNLSTLLKNVRAVAESLPSEDQRAELDRALEALTQFITELRAKIASLPTREQTTEAAQAIVKVQDWLTRAQSNPALRAALGLSTPSRPSKPVAVAEQPHADRKKRLLEQLEGKSMEQIGARLMEEDLPLSDLRSLASELGVSAAEKAGREVLAQQLAPKIVNYKSYWRLGREEEQKP